MTQQGSAAIGGMVRRTALGLAFAGALMGASIGAHAQAVVMAGVYQNFDVLNNTGQQACGFEMEVHGLSSSQLTRIFPSNFNASVIRYGFGNATDFPGGVFVRWEGGYDAASGTYPNCTPVPPTMTTVPGDSCWTWGMPNGAYEASGCEHFGISAVANPTSIVYRWLVPDPSNPGKLMYSDGSVSIPAPAWVATPPANPALPPVINAQVEAPPAPQPFVFGDAQWVKVYKRELAAAVPNVDDLVGDNAAMVPEDAAELETAWSLLQADAPALAGKKQRGKLANGGNLGNGNHAVVRRYEYYKYAGVYDAITHEALCADGTCTAPGPGELGDAIGAQNVAANLVVNALNVNVVGGGNVSSSDRIVSCGTKCYGVYTPGTPVTLSVKPNSGNVFTGWSGGCTGVATTCTVVMAAETSVTANFAAVVAAGGGGGGGGAAGGGGGGGGLGGGATFTLSVGKTNVGTITATPDGTDRALNCGASCSAKYLPGTAVTLTATPAAGKSFVNWSGACAGAATQCTVTINANASVTAVFSK